MIGSFNGDKKENIGNNFNRKVEDRILDKGDHERVLFTVSPLQSDRCRDNVKDKLKSQRSKEDMPVIFFEDDYTFR
jgi:hypothetical protein